jgi:hypothetical protein
MALITTPFLLVLEVEFFIGTWQFLNVDRSVMAFKKLTHPSSLYAKQACHRSGECPPLAWQAFSYFTWVW